MKTQTYNMRKFAWFGGKNARFFLKSGENEKKGLHFAKRYDIMVFADLSNIITEVHINGEVQYLRKGRRVRTERIPLAPQD